MAFSVVEWTILGVIIFHFFTAGLVTSIVLLGRWRWPIKVEILQNVDGRQYVRLKDDRARIVAFGDGGEHMLYLKRWKKYRPAYGKRVGFQKVLFVIAQDGLWYTASYEDFDKRLFTIGIKPIDMDARFGNASIRKGIEARHDSKTWMEKYAVPLTVGMLIFAMCVQGGFAWWNGKQQTKIAQINAESAKTTQETQKLAQETLAAIANLREQGGSGIRQVLWLPLAST